MIDQINQTFNGVSSAIQACASNATESAEISHEMNEQAGNLKDLVDQFKF